jgi:hypothetical protein
MNCDPYFKIMCAQKQLEHRERNFPFFKKAVLVRSVVETEMQHVKHCLHAEMHKLDVAYALERD